MGTLRRLLAGLFALVAALGGSLLAPVGPAGAQALPDDPSLGLVYDGLHTAMAGSLCGGAFEAFIDAQASPWMKQVLCTHGPDPAPDGVDVRENREPDFAAAVPLPSGDIAAAETAAVPCYGNGSDGFRIQLVYARSTSGADRFANYASSFNGWAARLDKVVNDSAAETGGTRHLRLVTDSSCNPTVERVTLSSGAMSNFGSMVSELHSKGYSRSDRKYLVWADTNTYCGISEVYEDDRADATPGANYNNGNQWIQGSIGRVDNGCWGLSPMVEAHELSHLLGGVQNSAPNATGAYHCNDESDRLCYADGGASANIRHVCPSAHEALYDCGHDDYFSTAPQPGGYLSSHWNTASSAFLSAQAPGGPLVTTTTTAPPPTTTTLPPTTTTTVPPSTTTTTTVTVPPTTTTTTATVPATTTTPTTAAPPPGRAAAPPSATQYLAAAQPAVGSGVQLTWQAPANGPVTGYRIYRGTDPSTQTLLATVPDVVGYNDASAGRSLYFYRVTAFNAAGEGASSNLTGMIGKTSTPNGTVREDIDRRLTISSQLRSAWAQRWA